MFRDGCYNPSPLPSYKWITPCSFGEYPTFRTIAIYAHLVSGSFHSSSEVLFNVSSRYIVRYRSWVVFRVGSWWLPNSREISNSRYSGIPARHLPIYAYEAITLYGSSFQTNSASLTRWQPGPQHHIPARSSLTGSVCPFPFSIAFTKGISIDFFSCGYWDVSLPRVPVPIKEQYTLLACIRKSH